MPRSTGYFKNETINFIVNNFTKNINILDVGAGIGTYSGLLREKGYINIDCVEAFETYVTDYNLIEKYNKVYVGDVTNVDIDFEKYDLIIFGDVLEHINLLDAQNLLSKLKNILILYLRKNFY
jgi:2-polyprenyl-3-methyl-5-hydroxy-6-metoxy-1,4-benzoquinol methylase